jgi:hypothetical protein
MRKIDPNDEWNVPDRADNRDGMVQIWVHAKTAKTLIRCALDSGEEIEDIVDMAVVKLNEALGI